MNYSNGAVARRGNAGLVVILLAMSAALWARQDRRSVEATADVNTGLPGTPLGVPAIVAGGFIYTSGLVGIDATLETDHPDFSVEARRTLERLKTVLVASGSSLAQTVSLTVYLRRGTDFDALNAVSREFFPDKPPARTTVVADLPHGALVMISAIGVPNGAAREVMQPAGWAKTSRPYSSIVRAGDLVFLSGLVSRRGSDDQIVPGSVALQSRTILENAGVLLHTAGLTYANVVAARMFLTDDSLFEAMNDQYGEFFTDNPPARSTGIVGLVSPDTTVEMTFVASTSTKQVLGPRVSPSLPVSTAVRAGPRVFLSGVIGSTDANVGDITAQARGMFDHISRTLDLAGLTFSDVVDSTLYLPDLWQADRLDTLYRQFFIVPPAHTSAGAKLVTRAALVEAMITAAK